MRGWVPGHDGGAGSNLEADRHVLRRGLMPTDDAQLLARISSDATGEALRALYNPTRASSTASP